MLTFLIESTRSGMTRDALAEMDARLDRAARDMTRDGRVVRHLGSTTAEDGLVIELQAPSAEMAAEVATQAGFAYDRVVESVRMGAARVRGDVCIVAGRISA